jgi:hypothetical protein
MTVIDMAKARAALDPRPPVGVMVSSEPDGALHLSATAATPDELMRLV